MDQQTPSPGPADPPRRPALFTRLVREPLLWFCLIGAGLFALDGQQRPEADDPHQIRVSAAMVDSIVARDTRRTGRVPDDAAVRTLVQRHIDEEILVRHGTGLGLDEGDPIIRRRIAQQLRLLADAEVAEPTDAELQAYLEQHADIYRRVEQWDVVLRAYGSGAEGLAAARLALSTGQLEVGARPLAFGDRLGWRSAKGLTQRLGPGVVSRLRQSDCRSWCGPVESIHGHLLLRIEGHRPARDPRLAELRPRLRERWLNDARQAARGAQIKALRARYTVTVDWPEREAAGEEIAP